MFGHKVPPCPFHDALDALWRRRNEAALEVAPDPLLSRRRFSRHTVRRTTMSA